MPVSSIQHDFTHFNLEDEHDNPTQYPYFIPISSNEKIRLYAPWQQTVITKLVGKRVGFMFLRNKLKTLWNLNEDLNLIDLGENYYLIKFTNTKNYVKVMHQGPWFVGSQFLSARKWEPKFSPH